MDYTKLPASLIFHKRESLEEYLDSNDLIRALVENMLEIDYLNKGDFEAEALNSMNTAYYICTIIILDKYPEWRWSFYLNDADYNNETGWGVYDGQEFVMALVYVLLWRFNKAWQDGHQKLMKKLFDYHFPHHRYDNNLGERTHLNSIHHIIGRLIRNLPSMNLPDGFFAPGSIDENAIRNAEIEMAQQNMGWQELTNDFNQKATKDLMDAVCKNDRERVLLAKAIKTEASKLGMDEKVDYLQPIVNAIAEANDNTDVGKNSDEITALRARIKQLEGEIRQLKEPLPKQSTADNQDEVDEQTETISLLKNDLEAFKTQDGKYRMTVSKAAIFIQSVCHYMGGLPNNKKKLAPILELCWGFTHQTAEKALGCEARQKVADDTALIFEDVSPKLARIIREFPKEFDLIRKKKLKANNDNKLKKIKEEPK